MIDDNQQFWANMVLVIDDEASVREAVKDVLMIVGINVLAAGSGREGIALYQEKMAEIGVILLDLSMPGIGGTEVLRELRQLNPAIKVILSSGHNSRDYILEFDRNTTFLQKPYDIDDLIEQIQHFVGKG